MRRGLGDGIVEASVVLASAEDQVVDEAVAALAQRDQARHSYTAQERRRDMRQLFGLVLRCVRKGRAEPIIRPSERIAAHCFASGVDLSQLQGSFNVLAEVLWPHLADALAGEERLAALRLVNDIVEAGKDAQARTYVALAAREGSRPGGQPAAPGEDAGSASPAARPDSVAADAVRAEVVGRVGVITLDDRHKRNAIGARMAEGVVVALESLRARDVRAIVLRAAAGMDVWSAGHDINELPRGRRDPLGYDDPLEGLLRAVRAFPAPVIAMIHGTVWGGALDLVLSCDLVVADETASFAITPANLGLPYNVTGLLHFLGRLPVNLIKEMFFTAAPLDARKAKEWLLVNHLVAPDQLEPFTLELAATMATKSPLAIAVIKEQLRVLSDYQPIAAQVYERVQGMRRQAYDSADYLEGLNAFTEKRQPIFRGA
jgi:methylmalonyl-CoA decarboxylase